MSKPVKKGRPRAIPELDDFPEMITAITFFRHPERGWQSAELEIKDGKITAVREFKEAEIFKIVRGRFFTLCEKLIRKNN